MEIKRNNYSKALIFFSMMILLVLMSGCNGGVPPIVELYGTIDINSTPSGAKVYLDGVDTGQVTPIILPNIDAGDHIIELRKFHYKCWEDVVTVIAGQTAYLNPPLLWAPEETITIQPNAVEGKDVYVIDIYPDDNNNTIPYLSIGIFTVPTTRSYLQFDLSSVPPEIVILDASLGLYYDSPYNLFSLPIGLYEVAENWVENTLTWNNQPASSNEAVDIQIILASQTNDFVYWYIADLVKGWHEGSISNYGIVLRDTDESLDNGGAEFFSSDWLTANQRPKLIIDFYVP